MVGALGRIEAALQTGEGGFAARECLTERIGFVEVEALEIALVSTRKRSSGVTGRKRP